MTSHPIKFLSAAMAAAALIATPALARTTKSHAAMAQERYAPAGMASPFQGSYAAADRAPLGANTVVSPEGRVLGADPDPNIRFEILRDAWVSEY
jgi:hypothetical protein